MERPSRKRIRLAGFDYSDPTVVFFLTICCADRQVLFSEPKMADVVVSELDRRRATNEVRVFCLCLMPDHLHLILALDQAYGRSLRTWVASFKRITAKVLRESFGVQRTWQKNFYEHVVRRDESLFTLCEYVLNNPTRKGLVLRWQDYPYSRLLDPLPM